MNNAFFKYLILKFIIFIKGIRFYETCHKPVTHELRTAIFVTVDNIVIKFTFYKEVFEDLHYKRNKITRESFIGYLIKTDFGEESPHEIKKFNNLKFIFNHKNMIIYDDEIITDILLHIYLKFIKQELKK